ncbi:MAG: glycosyltransferase, partial [Candidatus Binataceae bacterium]
LDFNQKVALRKRLQDLKAAHTTGLILTAEQAEPVLGLAAQARLDVLVELEVAPDELLSRRKFSIAVSRVAHTASVLRGHSALIGFLIDCAIEPDALRHHGLQRIRRRLLDLIRTIRPRDESMLVALKHRPATCALSLLDEDLIYACLPALTPEELRRCVIRLHNLAAARPLILEFGTGLTAQDELVACAFGLGAAGVVAPPMRPASSPVWLGIKMLSASELLPFVSLNGSCPPPLSRQPMVSVVICAYNAERTMRPCLESLRRLEYPNYEVIIVDDGSRDRTAEIATDFPEFRLIRQPNKGLSAARNVGLRAAHGELIAYTDSDCVVDPHWLNLMVRAMVESAFDGCGGPNYAPHEEGWVEGCVAASPGAPCHVLTDEDRAEHLAGCNMVFSKAALLKVGGFDAQFTSAGDDVDLCWRMLDAGFTLGYCPAAFVWHFRRNTVKAYYGQQRGYGRAEAMLYLKYPQRFNALGQIKWRGTIPGLARTVPGGSRMRVSWTRGRSGFQTIREGQLSVLKVLPLTLEWNLVAVAALMVSVLNGFAPIPALAALGALALGPVWALYYAARAPLEKCHSGLFARLFIAMLAYSGPITRALARYRYGTDIVKKLRVETAPRQRPTIDWLRRTVRLAYWNESYTTREALLERVSKACTRLGYPALPDSGWNDFDLAVQPASWVRVEFKTADEEHEGTRLKNHVAARIRLSQVSRIGLAAGAACTLGAAVAGLGTVVLAAGAVTIVGAVLAVSEALEAGRLAYRAVEECASELKLIPLGQPTAVIRRAAARGTARSPVTPAEKSAQMAQPAGQ